MTHETKHETCYLLVGGADGMLDISLRAEAGRSADLTILAKTGFGAMIWQMVAQMFIGSPLVKEDLQSRIARMYQSGLSPEELNLEPLINTLVRMGK